MITENQKTELIAIKQVLEFKNRTIDQPQQKVPGLKQILNDMGIRVL